MLETSSKRNLFLRILEEARQRYRFVILGYVIMPEHFHMLISEPQVGTPSTVMQVLKQRFAHQLRSRAQNHSQLSLDGPEARIWQPRFYDFNVRTEGKRMEKLRYMHRNPVKRELVSAPVQWAWSSFRHYFCNDHGIVRVNDCAVMELRVRPPAA